MALLPKDSTNQEYGRLAQRAFASKIPRSWISKETDGDADYGIDYIIQLINPDKMVEFNFYLQLKGTSVPTINSDDTLSYVFKCSTLRYYHSLEPLVMVAVVDLKDHMDDLHNCSIYYMWLDAQWFKENELKLNSQESITIKIPIGQLLTTNLDVYDYYKNRIKERMALTDLSFEIKQHTNDIISTIGSIKNSLIEKPYLLKILEHSGEEPWIENPEGQYATELKKVENQLQNNKILVAKAILDELQYAKCSMTTHELAEFWYQMANYEVLIDNDMEAEKYYDYAAKTSDKIRYLIGAYESRLRNAPAESAQVILNALDSKPSNDKRVLFLKVKCLVLIGKSEDAITLIDKISPDYLIAKLLIFIMTDDSYQLEKLTDSVDIGSIKNTRERLFLHFAIARRSYLKANHDLIKYDEIVPIHGLPNANLELMKVSYEHYKKAWRLMEELGYPHDFTLLLDISPLVFTYFNNLSELFEHFENILKERSEHSELINVYSRLLFNQSQYEKVISLYEKPYTNENIDNKILIFLSFYNLQKPVEAFELFNNFYPTLVVEGLENRASLFAIASRIANGLFDTEAANKFMDVVKSIPHSEPIVAYSEFIEKVEIDSSELKEQLKLLYQKYISLGEPLFLAEQLIGNMNVIDQDDAIKFVNVANTILRHHGLADRESYIYVHSLIVLEHYAKAIDLINEKLLKDNVDPNWHFLKALALHNEGKPGQAIDHLSESIQLPSISEDILRMYIQLCFQFGLYDEIEKTLISVIAKTPKSKNKVPLLFQLYSVYRKDEQYRSKRLPVLRQLGKIVNQDDINEEGRFLSLVLFSDSDTESFEMNSWRQRLTNYTLKFPESTILKKANIDPATNVEELHHSLNKLTGVTPEILKLWENNKLEIRNGSLPVPFSMRGGFLKETRNAFTTWTLSKHSPELELEFKFRHARFSEQNIFESLISTFTKVILEETSLFILCELQLLESFLDNICEFNLLTSVFNSVIANAQSMVPMESTVIAQNILSSINKNRSKLQLVKDDELNRMDAYLKYYNDNKSIFLCDDLYLQNIILSFNKEVPVANIFNVIMFLNNKGCLKLSEAYDKISDFCDLGVVCPYMTIQLLSDIFTHYDAKCKGYRIFDTKFCSVYSKVFSPFSKDPNLNSILFKMLINNASSASLLPSGDSLINICRTFLLHHQNISLDKFITAWFVQQCAMSSPTENEEDLIYSSDMHKSIWRLYKSVMCDINTLYTSDEKLILIIVEVLRTLEIDNNDRLYRAIKRCFIPLSPISQSLDFQYFYSGHFINHS